MEKQDFGRIFVSASIPVSIDCILSASVPAFSASTVPFSFLPSYFLVCLHTRLLLVLGFYERMNFYCSEKHDGHADHEEAQAGDQAVAVEDRLGGESEEECAVHSDVYIHQ